MDRGQQPAVRFDVKLDNTVPTFILVGMCPISPAWTDPVTMGRNLYLLLGAWGLVLLVAAGLFAVWMATRMLLWRRAIRRATDQAQEAQRDREGKLYPPSAGGVCDRCGQAHDRVYYLPTGQRRCQACYEKDLS